ncbi:MAG TPA: hypothetical protein VK249_21360 [Anaerolineales bacterium]|nr:hypothetical protein [Anaerolineales bacterium]
MFQINRPKLASMFRLVFVGVFIIALLVSSVVPALAQPLAAKKTSRLAYHDEWRKLWEDHITWTRVVIIGILDGLPGTDAYVGRLLQNYEDMEAALKPYYGDEAEVFGDLVKEHLVIAAEILTALKNGQPTDQLIASWYANGHDIAVQMNKMNPQFWPLAETDQMWKEHLDATLEEATDHFTGDFAGEVAAYDKVHDLALDMADFFSNGVIKQFPSGFTG